MLDVVGWASLVEDDEEGTLARWHELRRARVQPAVARHGGRVFKDLGDGVLIEFGTVEQAVRCAIEVQSALPPHIAPTASAATLSLRCAIHLAEVVALGGDLLGDGVNVVARLQEVAEPGSIIVSAPALEQVRGRLDLPATDLGELRLKNLRRPIRAFGLLGRTRPPGTPAATTHRPSIAVVPFREYGRAVGDSYFGDGLVEDVVTALASVPDLFVISRGSTMRFRDRADARAVGRELGVRYVLSGTVRRERERLRLVAELSDTETGAALWTDRIDGTADDLFALQDRLSERTVTTIAPHVHRAEMRRALAKRPENLDAYDFMLRGLDGLYRLRREAFDRAREMFSRSIELDPGYAAPYALTAIWYSIRIWQGWSAAQKEDFGQVTRLVEAGLDRDPFDARALALGGHLRALIFHDYDGAFALLDRAIAASPNSALAWTRSSPCYSYVGDPAEGRRRARIGIRLSPLDPHLFLAHTALALAGYTAEDYDDAAAWGRKAMAENPQYTANLRFLAASLAAAGRTTEAGEIGRALLGLEPGFRVQPFCDGYAYRDSMRREALARHLRAAGLPD